MSAAARLDAVPIGAFHRRLLFLIGAGMFFDSFDIYLAGSVLGALIKTGWSDLATNAHFISATFIGMVIGAFGAGVLGDRYGRKFTYQFNLAIFGAASFACALAPNMTALIVARFICGIGLGAEIVIGYATMIEFTPPEKRGRWGALLSFVTNFGLFASTLLAWLIIPTSGWRWMFAIAGVGAFSVLWLRKAIPESPRWLESQGRYVEAETIVASIERECGVTPGRSAIAAPVPLVSGLSTMLPRLFLGGFMHIAIGVAIYGFVVWVPTFLVQHGMGISQSLGQTMLMSMGGPAGALLGFVLTDRVGRKKLIIGASLLGAVVGTLFAQASSSEMAVALGFLMFTLIYLLVAAVVAVYVPELFPTRLRMRGNGICNTAGRVTTIFVPQLVVLLFNAGGVTAVLGGVAAMLVAMALAVALFGVETSGRSLEAVTAG